jgi:hypothetical protein
VLLERQCGTEVGAQASIAVVVDLRPRWPVLEDLKERRGLKRGEKRRNGRERVNGRKFSTVSAWNVCVRVIIHIYIYTV